MQTIQTIQKFTNKHICTRHLAQTILNIQNIQKKKYKQKQTQKTSKQNIQCKSLKNEASTIPNKA